MLFGAEVAMVAPAERNSSKHCGSILIFDGEPVLLDLLAVVLTREGYGVTTTPRSEEALGLATSGRFDLAIADLGLRHRDGCRLVRKLRQLSPEIPIVATTAYPASEIVSFAEEHAEILLSKPFAIGELVGAVREVLQRQLRGDRDTSSPLATLEGLPATMSGAQVRASA
ncbi:MAG TPA: response regulator [Chloroflexi bacterium]|nr:response regulator [Chloroflexota bacterium]